MENAYLTEEQFNEYMALVEDNNAKAKGYLRSVQCIVDKQIEYDENGLKLSNEQIEQLESLEGELIEILDELKAYGV